MPCLRLLLSSLCVVTMSSCVLGVSVEGKACTPDSPCLKGFTCTADGLCVLGGSVGEGEGECEPLPRLRLQ